MLRSMKAREELISKFHDGKVKRCCIRYMCCRMNVYKSRMFLGNWLRVKKAKDPSIINWENLNTSMGERFLRYFVSAIISVVLMAVTIILLLSMSSYQNTAEKKAANYHCQGLNDPNCQQWIKENVFVYLVSIAISITNILIDKILKLISQFESPHTKTSQLISTMIKVFVVEFINTAVIIFLVNFNLDISIFNMPIIDGNYTEFSVEWYRVVGSTIVLTMLIRTVSPHIATIAQVCITGLKRCYDRRCTCDNKRTRKVIQTDYENVYMGPEFTLDSRYAQTLTVIFTIFMYSSGLPILYMIGFVYFLFTYWVDKILCKPA